MFNRKGNASDHCGPGQMERVSMNDIAGVGGSRQEPFEEEPEDDAHASLDTVRAVIQRQLREFDFT